MTQVLKKGLRTIVVAALLFGCVEAKAQQQTQFSQYMYTSQFYNPASIGLDNCIHANLFHRTQWADIDGAPQTTGVGIEASLDNKINLGLIISHDQIGISPSTEVKAQYAYRMRVGVYSRLSFGLSAGVNQNGVDAKKYAYADQGDQMLQNRTYSLWTPDIELGAHYQAKNFYVGMALKNFLVASLKDYKDVQRSYVVDEKPHFYLTAGGNFPIDATTSFRPSMLIREDFKSPTNVDLSALFFYKEFIGLGLSYRSDWAIGKDSKYETFKSDAMAFIVQIYATPRLRIGYSYDYQLYFKGTGGSHEITLGYCLMDTQQAHPKYFDGRDL